MRNLKRALSLTLASVMLLGMMVVGAGAAGFPDVADDNDNVEAIEVLQAIEVMVGNADTGNFEPDRSVTRTEMAVVMANLLKLDYKYYEASCPFWDVPTWAKSYVGACYANKIVSGYGDGTYGALDPITPVQAASMMMRALGYFQYSEDYKDGFETATVRQGTQIGIFEGIGSSADKDMTRGQVARMALNALESEMVTFTGTPGSTYTASNGESITVGYVAEYTPRTSTELKYKAIEDRTSDASLDSNHRGQYYIQLGEELYNGKLTKKFERDEFERPSINWQYNGKEIGTYVDYELKIAEFLTGVTGAQMYDELTYTTINDNDLLTYVDGVDSDIQKGDLVRSNKNDLTGTGTGVLTEVFVDLSRDEVTITSINTWLAKANSDYNSTNDSLSLKVFTNRDKAAKVSSSTKIVDGAKIAKAEDLKKDEYVLVYMSGKDNTSVYNDYARFDVVKIFDAEILSDIGITKWSRSDTKVSGDFTADGTVYKTNTKAFYDGGNVLYDYNETLLTDMSYNVYLDRYGNAIGVDLHEGTKNYVFITGYDRVGSNISVKTADAAAIFLDGTMDVIKVNVKDTNKYIEKIEDTNANFVQWTDNRSGNGWLAENRWYTYTVNNNGVYTLKPAERMFYTDYTDAELGSDNAKILNSANLYVDDSRDDEVGTPSYTNLGRAYGNDDSIYITVEADSVDHSGNGGIDKDAIVDVNGVYTGAQNVKLEVKRSNKEQVAEAYVYTVYDSSYYIIASIVLGDAQGTAANYAYILDGAKNERVEFESASAKAAGDATYYWEFDAVLNGEKQTLTAKSKYNSTILGLKKFHVQELRYDGDYVTNIVDVKADKVMDSNQTMEKIDKMDVYDVGHVAAVDAFGEKVHTGCTSHSGNAYGYSDHRLDGTIELVGRTLYTERVKGGNNKYDVGLALASDAKAVLVQVENGKTVSTQCSSVNEAIGRLADADTRNVPAAEGIQFQGRIVAVLKDGIAQWVVIISDTELRTNDKDYNSGTKSYLTWDKIDQEWDLKVPDSEWVANPTTTQIARWLERAGCSNVSKTRDGWNFTFEGYDYTNQYINVLEPVVADTYTVTVADAVNGKVSVSPKGKLEKGTVVTISATGNTGYVVDKITVETEAGAPVTVTSNKFTMPAANVTVTVTFKADVPPVEGITFTGSAVEGEDFTAVKNEDGTYTITATDARLGVKAYEGEGYTVTGNRQVWTITATDAEITVQINKYKWDLVVDDNGNMGLGAVEVPAPAARMARSVTAPAAEDATEPADDGFMKITFTGLDGLAKNTFVVKFETRTDKDGNEVSAYWFGKDNTAEELKALADAMNKNSDFDITVSADVSDEEKTDWNGGEEPNPPASEADDRCQAVIASDGQITINVYKGFKPTEDQIKAAIAKATGKNLTSKDIDITDPTDVVIGKESGFTLIEAQGEMIKVTIQDKAAGNEIVKYALPNSTITGLPETVLALLPAGKIVSDAESGTAVADKAVPVSDGSAVLPALTADTEYVSALKLWTTAAGSEKIFYANGETTGYTEITDLTTQKYVQVKAPLMVRLTGIGAGAKGGITINGVDYTGTADAQGNLEISVSDLVGYAESQNALTIAAYTPKKAYTVKIDGQTIANPSTEDGKWFENDVITLTTPVTGTLIAGKQCAAAGTTKTEALPGSGYKKIQITSAVTAGADASTGVLELNTAYAVAGLTFDTDFTLADPKAGDGGITLVANDLIAKDYELTLTAASAGETAKVKDGSKYTLGAPTWNADGKAVYTIKVTADIAADEFVKDLVVTTTGLDSKTLASVAADADPKKVTVSNKAKADGTVEIAVTSGLTAETKVEYEWSAKGEGNLKKLTIDKPTIDTTNKKIVFTFTNNTGADVELSAVTDQEDAGVMLVTIGDIVVEVTIKVAAKS